MSSSSNTRDSHTEKNDVLPVGTSTSPLELQPAPFQGKSQVETARISPIFSQQKHRCQFCLELLQIATHLGSEINY